MEQPVEHSSEAAEPNSERVGVGSDALLGVEVLPPLDLKACDRCGMKHPEPALYQCDNCMDRVCRSCYCKPLYECRNCAPNDKDLARRALDSE